MIFVHADLVADFKKCCMPTGLYDGVQREHYQR